jgi:hypothetical protein
MFTKSAPGYFPVLVDAGAVDWLVDVGFLVL